MHIIKSQSEQFIKDALEKEGIKSVYEPKRFPLNVEGMQITYTPDFELPDFTIKSKTLLLETHGEIGLGGNQFNDRFLKKLYTFKHSGFSESYYLIMITDINREKLWHLFDNRNLMGSDLYDEIWFHLSGQERKPPQKIQKDLNNGAITKVFFNERGLKFLISSLKARSVLRQDGEANTQI